MLSGAEEAGFGAWWPLADPVVRALLRQHGTRHEDIDDVVQATAEKAWRTSKVFNDAPHFVAWCCTVALNTRVDQWRKTQREVCTDIPECDGADRPDDLALTLVTRTALLAAIARLPRAERDAVLGSFEPANRIEATRFAVARHRGRSKLRDVLKGLSAAFGRFGRDAAKHLVRGARRAAAGAAMVVVALAGVGVLTQLQLTRPVPSQDVPVWRDAGASPLLPSGLARTRPTADSRGNETARAHRWSFELHTNASDVAAVSAGARWNATEDRGSAIDG